jgi:hypothetical protein
MEVSVPSVQALMSTALPAMLKTNAPHAVVTLNLMMLVINVYARLDMLENIVIHAILDITIQQPKALLLLV